MESTSRVSIKYLRDYITLLAIAGAIVILDQTTKSIVRANLALGEFWVPWDWLAPYVRIVNWKNTGAAFGMLQGLGDIFAILAVVVAVGILYYFPQVPSNDWPIRVAMGLEFGGAAGNLIDRLTIGWVTDFISIWRFPVFNVADFCITFGVIVLILGTWIKEKDRGELPNTDSHPDSDTEAYTKEN